MREGHDYTDYRKIGYKYRKTFQGIIGSKDITCGGQNCYRSIECRLYLWLYIEKLQRIGKVRNSGQEYITANTFIYTAQFCNELKFQELTVWEVDSLEVDISGVDILRVDILGGTLFVTFVPAPSQLEIQIDA